MKVCLFNHSNCNHPSLEVVVYLFLSSKRRQSSILWSVLCLFHSLYHCCHSLSLIAIFCHSLYHSLSLFVIRCTIHCHSLSFVVTRCHSLSLVVPLVVIRCHSLYHSLSLVVICCHSLYHSLSLVFTRCTTRLSFYKSSFLFS